MGALLGYLLTKRIIKENNKPPEHLFFTGCAGPSVRERNENRHLLPKDQFLRKLKQIGGVKNEILNDNDLFRFFEPIIRSDFQSVDTYQYQPSESFDLPITCIIGSDEEISPDEAATWKNETLNTVDILVLSGNHFFIFDHEMTIMKIIENKLLASHV